MAAKPDPIEAVVAAYEPKVAAELLRMLAITLPRSAKQSTIEAFIRAGDLTGLVDYISMLYMGASPIFLATLRAAANEAADLAVLDIRAAAVRLQRQNAQRMAVNQTRGLAGAGIFSGTTAVPTARVPLPEGVPTGVVFHGAEGFAYNPVNPRTIAATRTWQGNLIREMSESARLGVMQTVREGLLAGENPREIARSVRIGLPLTSHQQAAVKAFHAEMKSIATDGMRSATSWGLFTPKQVAALKVTDPVAYRALNFTAREVREGRRWGKISRAAGTLAPGAGGVKPSRPLGFVAPPETQGGTNAFRIDATGKPIDRMTQWRLRDKTFDPLLYDIVEAREAGDDVAEALARKRYDAKIDEMATRYRERYIKHRSEMIARTETLRAAHLGSYEAWRQSLDESDLFQPDQIKREWRTAGDDRVRMMHRAANGQKRGMHEPFMVDGIPYMIPPGGIACRCKIKYNVELTP